MGDFPITITAVRREPGPGGTWAPGEPPANSEANAVYVRRDQFDDVIHRSTFVRELVHALRLAEWGGSSEWCDACKMHKGKHTQECPVDAALAKADAIFGEPP